MSSLVARNLTGTQLGPYAGNKTIPASSSITLSSPEAQNIAWDKSFKADIMAGKIALDDGIEVVKDAAMSLIQGYKTETSYRDVIDFLDTPLFDAAITNVPASSASPIEVVASLASDVVLIHVGNTIGYFIGLYSGSLGNETLECVLTPGLEGYLRCRLARGSRISLRHMKNAVINKGEICLQFIG